VLLYIKLFKYIPKALGQQMSYDNWVGLDLDISNLAISHDPVYICGSKIHTICAFITQMITCNIAVLAYTYAGKARFRMTAHKKLAMNADLLFKIWENTIDEFLE
jgi:hypothetical protein